MFGLAKYRLRELRPDEGVFDFLDPESGEIVGEVRPGVVEDAKRGSISTALAGSLPDRLLQIFLPVSFLFWLAGLILRAEPLLPPPNSRPRLIVQRPDGGIVLTLRVSSGLLHDSRRVYDGQGRLVAHFRSRSKSSVRGGFEIIDLRGCEEDGGKISDRPALGHVAPSGGVYRFRLVNDPDAGRITPHTASPDDDPPETMARKDVDHCDVDASPSSRRDETSEILLLAAALTVAWSGHYVTRRKPAAKEGDSDIDDHM